MKIHLSAKLITIAATAIAASTFITSPASATSSCESEGQRCPSTGKCHPPSISVTVGSADVSWRNQCGSSESGKDSSKWAAKCGSSESGKDSSKWAAKCGSGESGKDSSKWAAKCARPGSPVGPSRAVCPVSKKSDQGICAQSSWLSQALSSSPALSSEFDAWERVSGQRPALAVRLGDRLPPSPAATFPAGLSLGREVFIHVEFKTAPQWAAFESKVRASVLAAYHDLSRKYYELGAAQQRAALLAARQRSLESIREDNRAASNAGQASWTEVVYLNSLVEAVSSARAANNLDLEVLAWDFKNSPLESELRAGKMLIWSPSDFWSFYAKLPPMPDENAAVNQEVLVNQFTSLMAMQESSRLKSAMSALYKQVVSEDEELGDAPPAAKEIFAAAKEKDAAARLRYIKSMLQLPPPVVVEVTKLPAPCSAAPSASAAKSDSEVSSPQAGKVVGILLLGAGIVFLLWASVKKSASTEKPRE